MHAAALLLLLPLLAAPKPARTPAKPSAVTPGAGGPNDLRPALAALKAADGVHVVHALSDGSKLVVALEGGKSKTWALDPARGTPEGVILFDRSPNPKDKSACALLLARAHLTEAYTIPCKLAPPVK